MFLFRWSIGDGQTVHTIPQGVQPNSTADTASEAIEKILTMSAGSRKFTPAAVISEATGYENVVFGRGVDELASFNGDQFCVD
jgi:hypothetical protein